MRSCTKPRMSVMAAWAILMAATAVWALEGGRLVEPASRLGTDGRINAIAFSPDGKTLATATAARAQLWDPGQGELKLTVAFDGAENRDWHQQEITSIAYSPDGKTIATGSQDKTAKLWDAETGRVFKTLRGHASRVTSVAFSPDGRTLATGSMDHTIRLWDPATGTLRRAIQVPGSAAGVEAVAYTRAGRVLADADYSGKVTLWDASTTNPISKLDNKNRPFCMAISPDGRAVVTGGAEDAKLWEVATGKVRALLHHEHLVLAVAFSPNGKLAATASIDRTAKLWDAATGELRATLKGHEDQVLCLAFSPDGKTIATGSEGTVILWEVPGE